MAKFKLPMKFGLMKRCINKCKTSFVLISLIDRAAFSKFSKIYTFATPAFDLINVNEL